jgi:hypothetical protein
MGDALSYVGMVYLTGSLLTAVAWTAFEVWDRLRNHTPWNAVTYGCKLILAAAAWPLLLVAYITLLPEILRRGPRG